VGDAAFYGCATVILHHPGNFDRAEGEEPLLGVRKISSKTLSQEIGYLVGYLWGAA